MLINISVKFHDSRSNTFWVTCNTSWKLQLLLSQSRAITLKILNKSRQKYPGAQLHMLINIPIKLHDSRSNTFWITCDTKENGRTGRWMDGRTDKGKSKCPQLKLGHNEINLINYKFRFHSYELCIQNNLNKVFYFITYFPSNVVDFGLSLLSVTEMLMLLMMIIFPM
jgi:hypothetical protein